MIQMAKNLREKLPSTSTLYINDVVQSVPERFVAEFGSFGPVEICMNAAEVVERSVSHSGVSYAI